MSSPATVTEIILHCQKQIKKNPSEEKLLHYLGRLKRLRIQVQDLVDTGIGRTVNQLSRLNGVVGQDATHLVNEWKALVEEADKSSSGSDSSSQEEEEDADSEDIEEDDDGALHINDQDQLAVDSDDSMGLPINNNQKYTNGYGSSHRSRSGSGDDEVDGSASTSRNMTSYKLDPNVKIKVEPSSHSHHKKSDNHHHHKENEKSKPKEKESKTKTIESKPIKVEKEDNTHRHRSSSPADKHKHSSHRHKRKNEEELAKPENGIKKLKTEIKVEKLQKPQLIKTLSREIDSTSGVNFADVLSCLDQKMSSSSKKKDKTHANGSNGSGGKHTSQNSSSTSNSLPSKRKAHEGKREGSKDRDSNKSKSKSVILPTPSISSSSTSLISPNYKPSAIGRIMAVAPMPVPKPYITLPSREIMSSLNDDIRGISTYPTHDGESRLEYNRRAQEDALSTMISSRNQRTKVYSGVKSGVVGTVPKLFNLCIRVIQENINELGYTGGVPFDILKPVLDRATADQLVHLENYNPYLIESTDDLWKFHCGKDFRGENPQEFESWRELYTRCVDERKSRFQKLTNKVKSMQEKAIPQMKTKLAYVDTTAGPRFHKTKADTIRSGMRTLKTREEKGVKRTHGSSASAGGSGSTQNITIEEASVIISPSSRAGSAPAPSRERESTAAAKKPKKAPLMQKTLKVIKTLFRR